MEHRPRARRPLGARDLLSRHLCREHMEHGRAPSHRGPGDTPLGAAFLAAVPRPRCPALAGSSWLSLLWRIGPSQAEATLGYPPPLGQRTRRTGWPRGPGSASRSSSGARLRVRVGSGGPAQVLPGPPSPLSCAALIKTLSPSWLTGPPPHLQLPPPHRKAQHREPSLRLGKHRPHPRPP